MTSCPDPNDLRTMIASDRLEEDVAIVDHIGQCVECQSVLESWMEDDRDAAVAPLSDVATTSAVWTDDLGARLVQGVRASLEQESGLTFEVPERLGGYRVLEPIGEGGMGTVFKARQEGLNRIVALKVIRRRSLGKTAHARRFRTEAESVAKLDHPGIVPIFEVSEQGLYIFYAMSYVSGGTLADRCRSGAIPWQEAAKVGEQISKAISYAHKYGVIHRDLKPSNVLLTDTGEPRIADFGLAKHLTDSDEITATGEILGTPAFMSPEQASGQTKSITESVDIYGIGGILYALLAGKPPFPGEDAAAIIYRVIHHPVPSLRSQNPEVPIDLVTIVEKCLSKRTTDRYSSAEELADDLSRLRQGRVILAKPPTSIQRINRWIVSHPSTSALIGLLIAVTVVGGGGAAYFRVLADRRQAELSSQASDLVTAKLSAEQSAIDAERESLRVKEQADEALGLLEEMVFKVQTTYVDNPAAQEQRRGLLQTVLERLERIPTEHVDSKQVSRLRAKTLLSQGEVVMQIGDGTGPSGISASRPYFEQAIEISHQLYQDDPENADVAMDMATCLIEFGDTLAYAGVWREANRLFEQALPISHMLAEAKPTDPDTLALLADNLMLSGEALTNLNRNADGKARLMEAASQLDAMHQEDSSSYSIYQSLCSCWQEIGDWYRKMKQFPEGQDAFEKMLKYASDMSAKFPLDSGAIMAVGSAHERLGYLAQDQGKLEEALRHQERGLELVEMLRMNSPDNDFIHWQVAYSYHNVATLCRRLGNLTRAREQIEKCVDVRLATVESDAQNRHYRSKLISSLRILSSVCRAQNDSNRELEALLLIRAHFAVLHRHKTDDSVEKRIEQIEDSQPAPP